jgi:hypothetical protein
MIELSLTKLAAFFCFTDCACWNDSKASMLRFFHINVVGHSTVQDARAVTPRTNTLTLTKYLKMTLSPTLKNAASIGQRCNGTTAGLG